MRMARAFSAVLALLVFLTSCSPGDPEIGQPEDGRPARPEELRGVELNYLYFTDGPDELATRAIAEKFEQATGARVNLQLVAYADLERTLQARLAGDNPPDVARTQDLNAYRNDLLNLRPYLSDPAFADAFLDDASRAVRGPSGELLGVPSDLTVNAPFVNLDLFEKAGVPVPERWTWPELVAAAQKVKQATGKPFALAMDKSGHRLATVLSQFGTTFFDLEGRPALDVAKATKALALFTGLHEDGSMSKDFWLESGSRYKGANEIFLAQDAPVYFSGNWQVSQLVSNSAFRWAAAPNPCAERCGGFPGGKYMVSFKQSKHRAAAAAFIEWMNAAQRQRELVAKAQFLPTRKDLVNTGVNYPERLEDMRLLINEVRQVPAEAYTTNASAAFVRTANALRDEVSKVLSGQGTPEDAARAVRTVSERAYAEAGGR
ncbi:alpha-1,4-digalacturonate transport system substrate-binding protein [Crossiella equi]|uniref:Alpha-1,4-digalacturonate transport system substrate-binding protein n=1 Tax=Crossiella equi TaxID=130796 RepID=A0ABS5AF98_9PSEU|nr:extracellular solute-binding protein [Crossiella equi]MBP2475259.1 alpha-1,4-digalacturonate transport system substrate-binding protein [Crossiella equi]